MGKHLFFLVHGLFGKESHMETMHLTLERELPSDTCIVYSSKSSQIVNTFDGVEFCALKIFEELLHLLHEESISKISIVGYSMGGLFARYLIGLLEENGYFDIIEPVNFATFATPHLGTTLWRPTLWTHTLNGIARALLGPSGVDLMSRGPNGVLDKMCIPHSSYMRGIRRFSNLMLFSNAIGDRTVRFWTSFITDKLPFTKTRNHDRELDLAFFTLNHNRFGPFIVDLNASRYKPTHPDVEHPSTKRKGLPMMIYFFIVVAVVGASVISLYSWIKVIMLKGFLTWKVKRIAKEFKGRLKTKDSSTDSDHASLEEHSLRRGSTVASQLEEEVHLAAEELPPGDSDSPSASPEPPLKTTTSPRPFNPNKKNLLQEAPSTLKVNTAIASRMKNLNDLPWKKYAVYLKHFRTHAHIIDRLKEGKSNGTELLEFFAKDVIV